MRKTILFTAAIVASLGAAPSFGQAAPPSRTVRFDDLELASGAGQAVLARRIAAAIETVCGSYAGATSEEARTIGRCRIAARSDVDMQLAALPSGRGGARLASAQSR